MLMAVIRGGPRELLIEPPFICGLVTGPGQYNSGGRPSRLKTSQSGPNFRTPPSLWSDRFDPLSCKFGRQKCRPCSPPEPQSWTPSWAGGDLLQAGVNA